MRKAKNSTGRGGGSGLNRELSFGKKNKASAVNKQSGGQSDKQSGKQSGLTLGKSNAKAKIVVPQKRTINLIVEEKSNFPKGLKVLIVVIIIVAAVLVGKFGIMDRFAKATELETQAQELQATLDSYNAYIANYDSVENDYNHYSEGYLTEDEATLIDWSQALKIVESKVLKKADITNLSFAANKMDLTIDNISLNKISEIVADLEDSKSVDYVSVFTAATDEEVKWDTADGSQKVTVTMSICFVANQEETTTTDTQVTTDEDGNIITDATNSINSAVTDAVESVGDDTTDTEGGE